MTQKMYLLARKPLRTPPSIVRVVVDTKMRRLRPAPADGEMGGDNGGGVLLVSLFLVDLPHCDLNNVTESWAP